MERFLRYVLHRLLWRAVWDILRPRHRRMRSGFVRRPIARHVRRAVFARDGRRCLNCGTPHDLQVDHILPVSRGGTNAWDNLQTLCGTCNRAKADGYVDLRGTQPGHLARAGY